MSPTMRKIRSIRKLHQKYVLLRDEAVEEFHKKYGDFPIFNSPSTILELDRVKPEERLLEIMDKGGDTGESLKDESDWENLGDGAGSTATEPGENLRQDEAASSEGTEPFGWSDKDEGKMDWTTMYYGGTDNKSEDADTELGVDDAALGETVELSELLRLEKEQPDDLLNQEVPARPTSPNNAESSIVPAPLGTSSATQFCYELTESDESDEDDFSPSEFIKTEVWISDGEWALGELLPYKMYQVKNPSGLRTSYTVVAQNDTKLE